MEILKRIIAIFILLCISITLFSCSNQGGEAISTTKLETTSSAITTEEATAEEFFEEETIEKQTIFLEKNKVIIDNGTYRFEIPKTNFEDVYSEELLLQFSNMLSMEFGVEDYYDWSTSGQNVFSDVRKCVLAINGAYKNYEFLDENYDEEAYDMFLADIGLEYNQHCEVCTFSLAKYNDYLKDFFGPDVIQLTVDDFETGKTAVEKGLTVDGDISESDTRCFYTGKDDIILIQVCATEYGCVGEYIYNVEKDGNDYYVYTVGEVETYRLIEDFDEFQNQALNDISYTIYRGYLPSKKYKFGYTAEGDVYLKSVDESFVVAENAEYDYIVTKNAEIKNKKADSEEYKVIGTITKGTKVIRASMFENIKSMKTNVYYVICDDIDGYINRDYAEEIDN